MELKTELSVLRRRVFGFLYAVLAIVFIAGQILVRTQPLGGALMMVAALAGMFVALARGSRRVLKGSVRASAEGISVDGEVIAAAAAIESGTVKPPHHVLLTAGQGREIWVKVPDVDTGRELVAALRMDPSHRAARFPIASPVMATPVRSFGFLFVLLATALGIYVRAGRQPLVAVGAVIVMLALAVIAGWPGEALVGSDAIVTTWLGLRRVLPLAAVDGVEAVGGAVRVHLRDGTYRDIRTGARFEASRDLLVERIRHALASASREPPGAAEVLALARGERSVEEWLNELRAMADKGSFRDLAIGGERLLAIVEDARADAETRAAAACALRERIDEEGRARLRVAAGACAEPRLRVALEAAAEGDDERVAAALDEVSRQKY